jgi:hypothetical protein
MNMRTVLILAITALASFLGGHAEAQEAEFARYLIPLAPHERAGAYGTQWVTTFSLFNDSDQTLRLGEDLFPWPGCPLIVCQETVPPGQGYSGAIWHTPLAVPGVLYYVRKDVSSRVELRAGAYESRRGDPITQIPVVSEQEFLTTPRNLLGIISTNERFRTLLRIYDPDSNPGGAVRVTAYVAGTGPLVAERIVTFAAPQELIRNRPIFAGYAEVPIDASFVSLPAAASGIPLRLKIEPIAPTIRYWVMASMTRNDTNEITIVTPDP